VWNAKHRKMDFTLGGHTASVNVVRWGGEGVIYTASSDRTVKLWDSKEVRCLVFLGCRVGTSSCVDRAFCPVEESS